MEMRGSSFLSLRAYGKYGITAVTRCADAWRKASSMISSSMMCSDSGGHARLHDEHVLLAHVLFDLDLEVLVREARGVRAPERMPSSPQISRASSGCDEPEKTFSPSAMALVCVLP